MKPTWLYRHTLNRKFRDLGSHHQVGRYARKLVWKEIHTIIKRYWSILLFIWFAPAAVILIICYNRPTTGNWVVFIFIFTSCFWIDVILILIWSGIAPKIMGISGEDLTSQVLKDFASKESNLINGLRFKNRGDIDHILIDSSGFYIFESKWSRGLWQMGLYSRGYHADQIRWAIMQIKKNRDLLLREFRKTIGDIEPHLVCVLWSAQDSSKSDKFFFREGVFGIRGSELSNWLHDRPKNVITENEVERIAKEIDGFARQRFIDDLNQR